MNLSLRPLMRYFMILGFLFLWIYWAWPLLKFPIDLDPSDGDVLNVGLRIKQGLPIYGDWKQGEIYGNYGPLYYLVIAFFSYIVDFPLLTIALRVLNAIFVLATFFLGYRILKHFTKNHSQTHVEIVYTILFFLGLGEHYLGALTLQSNALLLFTQVLLLYLLCLHPRHWMTCTPETGEIV